MCRFLFAVVCCLCLSEASNAAVITIKGTITSVDAKARTIIVEAEGEQKTLDVSRKAKVNASGKAASLDSLRSGQRVTLSYHEDLEIVLKINMQNDPRQSLELLEVSELSVDGDARYPWLSQDGLTIYWEPKFGSIWVARRKNAASFFEDKRELFSGRHPTLSADELNMVCLVDGGLYSTSRPSLEETFARPRLIRELKDEPNVKNPCLSPDGLKLYFNRQSASDGVEIVASQRSSLDARWSAPKSVSIRSDRVDGSMTWVFVSGDSDKLFCSSQGGRPGPNGNLMLWQRSNASQPFRDFSYIQIPGTERLVGRSPRYVAATNELFFTRPMEDKKWTIWVIKNFDPSSL